MLTKNFTQINGHRVFNAAARDEDYKFEGFEALFAHEESYFWFVARKELIGKMMKKFVPKSAKFIEVGAGTGNVAGYLQKSGFEDVAVGEMHLKALDFAAVYGLKTRYCFDLLDVPFENDFDCVGAFDVLEHLENDALAVQNIAKMLKNFNENLNSNLGKNLSENLSENSNLSENLNSNLDKNFSKNLSENSNLSENLNSNLGKNFSENLSENSNLNENLNEILNSDKNLNNSNKNPNLSTLNGNFSNKSLNNERERERRAACDNGPGFNEPVECPRCRCRT